VLPVVAILCGGKGTRMREGGETVPKPLVEIGGRPILWHVMSLYAAQGFERFLLLTGNGAGRVERFATTLPWDVQCVGTGAETPTGGRVARAREQLGGDTFCLTYADGVADIDLEAELAHHRAHGDLATMAVVRPELQFGVTEIGEDDRVSGFHEKPRSDHWINGGFFFLQPGVFDYLDDSSVFEREPLEGLAADDQLHVWRHTGFWECMDTYKDAVNLNDLWAGQAPWRVWD
jgi:glucose-1-phosphate cytidylyltransferase